MLHTTTPPESRLYSANLRHPQTPEYIHGLLTHTAIEPKRYPLTALSSAHQDFAVKSIYISLYAKVWFSFRVLANLAGKTHKSAPNLVQIEQIPRYHPHTLKTSPSFIFEAIQISASHEGNPESYLPCLKLLPRILETRFNFT